MSESDDEENHIRETYARYGCTTYRTNVVELGLAQTLLQIEFMTPARENVIKTQGKNFDRKRFESDFTAFMEKQFTKTMGMLALQAANCSAFGEDVKRKFFEATKRLSLTLLHLRWLPNRLLPLCLLLV